MASFSMTEAGLLLLWIRKLSVRGSSAARMKFQLQYGLKLYGKEWFAICFAIGWRGDCKVIAISTNKFKQVHERLS